MREALQEEVSKENVETAESEKTEEEVIEDSTQEDPKEEVTEPEEKQTGVQRRINKLTAEKRIAEERAIQNEARLEQALKDIEALKAPKPEAQVSEEPDFSEMDAGDLVGYLKDHVAELVEKGVKERLSLTSQEMLDNQAKSKTEKLVKDFQAKLTEKFQDSFEDEVFVGTDEQRALLLSANDLFQSKPDFYSEKVEKYGADYIVDLIQDKQEQNKTTVNELMEKAEKAKGLKAGSENVAEGVAGKKLSMKDALKEIMNKNK